MLRWLRPIALALAAAPLAAAPAAADQDQPSTGLWDRDTLTGDWWGVRPMLKDWGVALGATETSEVLGALDGPQGSGAIYEGRLELDLDLDLEKLTGVADAVIHASAYQIHGRGLSANYLTANLLTASNIEATRSTRLFDLWLQKGFFADALSIRLGQIAADDEFITSQYASTFVNATFGWPGLTSADLPLGGPAYPLATPGMRIKGALSDAIAVQAAIFDGNPAGPGTGGDPSGTAFNLGDEAFMISEVSYAPQSDNTSPNWPTTYKLGAWFHTGTFDDRRRDRSGLSLADPAAAGVPLRHRGEAGVYAVIDQALYRTGESDDRGVGGFLRVGIAPGDQNLVSLYVDTGITWKGPLDLRPDDALGLAFAYAQVSGAAAGLDRDLRRFGNPSVPVRDFEAAMELTYQAALAPWWSIQPDLQYILHPTPASGAPRSSADGAAVIGLRSSVRF